MPTPPPRDPPPPTPLLCCICSEQNTTFRYEVVYSQNNRSITLLDASEEERQCLTQEVQEVQEVPEEKEVQAVQEAENQYYNYPPRHPRHGHLSWPVWAPTSSEADSSHLSITYPDHPIHIPTLTLRRIYSQLASQGAKQGMTSQPARYLAAGYILVTRREIAG